MSALNLVPAGITAVGTYGPFSLEPIKGNGRGEAVSCFATAQGGTAGQTATLEFHAAPTENLVPSAGDAATLVGSLTLTIGTADSFGVTARGKLPDLSGLPNDWAWVIVTAIGTGGITLYPVMGGS